MGAGILGLAAGRELTRRFPGIAVTVFDKESHVAAHQSGHNSGVLHAGIYYRPDSLKAELCLRGGELLRRFCEEHAVGFREVGKLIVASGEDEMDGMAELERRALANRVPGVRRLTRSGMREIEPYVEGVAGLHSPHTAAVDYPGVCDALVKEIRNAGGIIELNTPVRSIVVGAFGVAVRSDDRRWQFDRLIACAGLQSDRIAAELGRAGDLRIIPFRGEYYELSRAAQHRVRGMIYPVPDPRYPFLGVHFTRGVFDGVHVGPNAVPALSLEGYRWRDLSPRDLVTIARFPGAWRFAREHWRTGVDELSASLIKARYLAKAQRYVPELGLRDLLPAEAGVRAQAVHRSGTLMDDFAVDVAGPVILVRNAPSPAATSSLAIAEHLVRAAVG